MSKKINYYEVLIVTKAGLINDVQNTFIKRAESIIAKKKHSYKEGADMLVVDVERGYTILQTAGESYAYPVVDTPHLSSGTNDSCYGTYVKYSVYSFKNKRVATIKKAIENHIESKYGGFANINLDFMTEVLIK